MARKRYNQQQMVNLAENDEDEDEDSDDGYDDFFSQEPIDTDEDSDSSRPMDLAQDPTFRKAFGTLMKNQRDIALALGTVAKAQKQILSLANTGTPVLRKHDPMGAAPPPPMGGAGADPMGGPAAGGPMAPPAPAAGDGMEGEDRLDLSDNDYTAGHGQSGKGGYANFGSRTVVKDDSASAFGEIDTDEPGNHALDPKHVGKDDTMITGKPGAGPGPLNKAFEAAVSKALDARLEALGLPVGAASGQISRSASAPMPGTGGVTDAMAAQINKMEEDPAELVKTFATQLTWKQLMKARVEMAPSSLPAWMTMRPFGT